MQTPTPPPYINLLVEYALNNLKGTITDLNMVRSTSLKITTSEREAVFSQSALTYQEKIQLDCSGVFQLAKKILEHRNRCFSTIKITIFFSKGVVKNISYNLYSKHC